jgi:transcriptional regulator with XRE-family HTH domain|nr:MAG TPA: Repressor protein CI [Caudoviricetes sp.]
MKNFGEKLKGLREERNLSQKELGDKMGGITQQTIAQYEKKETVPKFETVSKIANALEINPNIFYSDFSQSTADDSEEIGERIKELRKSKGVSQKELAQKAGLSIGSIQGYEQGRYNPKLEAIVKMADTLEVELDNFYDALLQHGENVSIGGKIKAMRLQKGVSQAALAKCLGVSAAMIYQYEVGKKKPKVETLSKIAGALGVDLKVFYDDLPQKTMELKRYENIALVNEFEIACFRLVNFPDSEEITEKYEKLRKKLIDRLSCM